MGIKRIICLAKSWRPGGYCVAGKELFVGNRIGKWIRPVGTASNDAVPVWASRYQDRSEVELLDIVDINLRDFIPTDHQQENWLLNTNQRWVRRSRWRKNHLINLCDDVETLWENGRNTSQGMNDYVPYEDARYARDSLRLIRIDRLKISVFDHYSRRRVQGQFRYNGTEYKLWIKDVQYEDKYKAKNLGNYLIGECCLTISLAGKHEDDRCYKLIAGIIRI